MRTGLYNISCDYIIGCNYSGCSYELSSTNSNINGSIIGKNYEVVSIDVDTYYNLTVINGDYICDFNTTIVCSFHFFMLTRNRSESHTYYEVILCILLLFYVGARTTTFTSVTINNNSILITSVSVRVLVPILIIVIILVVAVILVLLIRNGKIQ